MADNKNVTDQPMPTTNTGTPIWDLVIEDMQARDRVGRERYKTPLQGHNGRDALVDLYQEAIDSVVYARQAIYERDNPRITDVFLDLDGVLVDFVSAALAKHGATSHAIIRGEWHMHQWLGISEEAFWKPLRGHDFWANLPWTSDATVTLSTIFNCIPSKMMPWLLSSPSDDLGSHSGKYAWVARELPSYTRRLILAPDKSAVARPSALLIDDSDANVNDWRAKGGQAILLPRLWNSKHSYCGYAMTELRNHLRSFNYGYLR